MIEVNGVESCWQQGLIFGSRSGKCLMVDRHAVTTESQMKGFTSAKKEEDNVNLFGGLWEAQAHDDKLVELNTNDGYCFVGDKRSKESLHKV